MKAIFRILGTAAAVAATGAAIVIMDKFLNEKAAPIIESIEFPEEAEKDDAEAAKTSTTLTTYCINFIYKYDTRTIFLSLLKEVTNS